MSKIKIEMPTKETPGFLRRSKRAAALGLQMQQQATPALFDEIIEFLLPFVVEPQNRDEAREVLWDASQQQFEDLMKAFSGGGNDTAVPPPNAAP